MNTALSSKVVKEFCELCNRAHVSWSIRKHFFDENPDVKYLKTSRYESLFFNLSEIIQEHWLLQLAKLHDPAVQGGQINLTINYIIEYGNWEASIESELKRLRNEMLILNAPIRIARNKILSHNDLASILNGGSLGRFNVGDDIKYFACLQDFANLIYDKTVGGPWPFDDLVQNDVAAFMNCFKRGSVLIDGEA